MTAASCTGISGPAGLAKLNDPWGDLVNWFRGMKVHRVQYRLVREALERMRTTPAAPLSYIKTPAAAAARLAS